MGFGRIPRVMVLAAADQMFQREVLRGIGEYAAVHGPWEFSVPGHAAWGSRKETIETWRGDGVILPVTGAGMVKVLRGRGMPFVSTTAYPGVASVRNDNEAIGELGTRHLLEHGYRNLAFFEVDGSIYAAQRAAAFERAAKEAGAGWTVLGRGVFPERDRMEVTDRYMAYLRELPVPCGVLAANDQRALDLLRAAERLGMEVPREVAIVGTDDELICGLTSPTLSSVVPDARRVGYEAAGMLAKLMRGEKLAEEVVVIPPRGLVMRRSTDTYAVEDELVRGALQFIRAHANKSIQVADVLTEVPASRKTMERRFLKAMGHSPWREIRMQQLAHVKKLLVETDWQIGRVARSSAFRGVKLLGEVFRQEVGMSPGEYRAKFRTR